MASTATSIRLPNSIVDDLDTLASETGRSREEALKVAIIRDLEFWRRHKELQETMSRLAKAAGIETEDDVEDFLDSIDD